MQFGYLNLIKNNCECMLQVTLQEVMECTEEHSIKIEDWSGDDSSFEGDPFDGNNQQNLDEDLDDAKNRVAAVDQKKKRMFRSTDISDVKLLKLIQTVKPWDGKHAAKWKSIKNQWDPQADVRSLQNVFKCLLKAFNAGEVMKRNKSSTDEHYSQKAKLLADINMQMKLFITAPRGQKANNEEVIAAGTRERMMPDCSRNCQSGQEDSEILDRESSSSFNIPSPSSSSSTVPSPAPSSQPLGTIGGSAQAKGHRHLLHERLEIERLKIEAQMKQDEQKAKLEQDKLQLERERLDEMKRVNDILHSHIANQEATTKALLALAKAFSKK